MKLTTIADLKSDPRNPRSITEDAAFGLRHSIKEFGDISGIVWNKRTSQLVAGHQRLKQLQEEYGNLPIEGDTIVLPDGEVFKIRIVDWDLHKQRAANLAANNTHIMGNFTEEAMVLLDEVKVNNHDLFNNIMFSDLQKDVKSIIKKVETASRKIHRDKPENLQELAWIVIALAKDDYERIGDQVEEIAERDEVMLCEVSSAIVDEDKSE